jgi:molybdopterin/thiamine biosynthesis adenylyltransferase
VTDPDHIEESNLINRQFLFREKHLRIPKSAKADVAQMNKLLKGKIRAKLDPVCETTKDIYFLE